VIALQAIEQVSAPPVVVIILTALAVLQTVALAWIALLTRRTNARAEAALIAATHPPAGPEPTAPAPPAEETP
jgi:hypothetical protein